MFILELFGGVGSQAGLLFCICSISLNHLKFVLSSSLIAFGDGVVISLVSFVDETLLIVIVVPPSSKLCVMLYSLAYLTACLKIDHLSKCSCVFDPFIFTVTEV